MKDSGIKWVGSIPLTWNVVSNRYLFDISKRIVTNPTDYQLLSLTTRGIKEKNPEDTKGKVPESYNGYQVVKPNDLVMCLFDLDCSAVFSGLSKYRGMISPAYKVLKINHKEATERYYNYWFQFVSSERFYKQYSKSLRYTVNSDEFELLKSVAPPLAEQKKIADFLDKKCAAISSIVDDIQKQIEVLEQYKRSAIIDAVTHGLNLSAPMKDSGIRYIGKIPLHWNTDKLKYHLKRNELRNPGNKQVLSLYREYGVIPKDSRDDNHNVTSEDTSKYKYVTPGDFVINKMKAWQGSVGIADYEGIISPAYFVYKFSDSIFVKKYFHYLLRSCYKDEFRRLSGGIREGQWDLSPEGLENTVLLIPPQEEQKEIADYLDKKCSEINSVIADKKAQLKTIEKYKKSLIYEYVTGKKEVVDE